MALTRNIACLAILALTACSADPAPGPTEQIIVREPGAAPLQPVAVIGDPASDLVAEGKTVFANCSACHAIEQDAPNGAGPNLFGIFGKPAAEVSGFSYSDALQASGIIWTTAELDGYIANPAAKVPGTTMVSGAIEDAAKRAAVIAYLESSMAN